MVLVLILFLAAARRAVVKPLIFDGRAVKYNRCVNSSLLSQVGLSKEGYREDSVLLKFAAAGCSLRCTGMRRR